MKKILSLMLALTMCLGLAACGNDNEPTETPAETPAETTPVETPAETGSAGDYGDFAGSLIEEGKLIMVTNASFPPL